MCCCTIPEANGTVSIENCSQAAVRGVGKHLRGDRLGVQDEAVLDSTFLTTTRGRVDGRQAIS